MSSRPRLRVTALELPARWNEPARAWDDVHALLAKGPPTDLVLLPEASLTGYVDPELACDLRPFAEPLAGPTTFALAALARAHHTHVVGPLVLGEGDHTYNALVAVSPAGEVVATYRKRHPWYVETWATPGTAPLATFEVKGNTVALAICFDVHFLEEESAAELQRADVLLFASAWVEREDSRPSMLRALARTFDVAIVNANWGPGVPRMWGQGASRIVSAEGEALAVAEGEGPQRLDANLAL